MSGWIKRVSEAIGSGLTAEAAVVRVAAICGTGCAGSWTLICGSGWPTSRIWPRASCRRWRVGRRPRPVPAGAILLARRLGPAQLLAWHARGIAGVVIEEGSASGHAAIVARALGLPALGGARGALDAMQPGDSVIIDADEGQLILRPENEVLEAYRRAGVAREARRAGWGALSRAPSVTRDGTPFDLMLNVGLALELEQLEARGRRASACSAPKSP